MKTQHEDISGFFKILFREAEVSFLFVNCLSVSSVEYITAGQPPTEPLSKAGGGTSSQSVTVRDI